MPKPESTSKSHAGMLIQRVAGNEDGGTAIEYALIAAGIGVAVAATVYSLGTTTAGLFQSIASLL
jgi:pilus assembly protein Flp/PilA